MLTWWWSNWQTLDFTGKHLQGWGHSSVTDTLEYVTMLRGEYIYIHNHTYSKMNPQHKEHKLPLFDWQHLHSNPECVRHVLQPFTPQTMWLRPKKKLFTPNHCGKFIWELTRTDWWLNHPSEKIVKYGQLWIISYGWTSISSKQPTGIRIVGFIWLRYIIIYQILLCNYRLLEYIKIPWNPMVFPFLVVCIAWWICSSTSQSNWWSGSFRVPFLCGTAGAIRRGRLWIPSMNVASWILGTW